MKLETAVIITKGACLTYLPTATAFVAGLEKWSSPTIFGVSKEVVVIIVSASAAGVSGLLAFISTSFSNYMGNRPGADKPPANPVA